MIDTMKIADLSNMIINGYAYTTDNSYIRVLNLNNPVKSAVIDNKGEIIETSMDDIELSIVLNYYERNKRYMEN